MKLYSPAKINLYFKIFGKRPDGYHEIETLMQAIDLVDILHFTLGKEGVTCPSIPEDNLITQAIELFRSKTGWKTPVRIKVEKNIPMEAGLGGGSSNAATTLFALRELSGLSIPTDTLAKWGSELGSDVPFFFSFGKALCTGRGERLENTSAVTPSSLWIAKPPFGLSTPKVFGRVKSFIQTLNDLEPAAFEVEPRLEQSKAALHALGFEKVVMTGSGTAFYCLGTPQGSFEGTLLPVKALERKADGWYTP